jgi:hypothetical protein
MNKIALPRVLKIAKLCHNFLYKENIIIFLGRNGVVISAFLQGQIIESKFIPSEAQDDLGQYSEFFDKFKEFHIFFLIDDSLSKISHVSLPILQGLVQTNPIEKFINEYFTQDDIVAYHVYDITKQPNELGRTIIVSTQYAKPISTITEYILGNRFKFGGIYHCALELQIIIDKILNKIGKSCPDYLQIFVTLLKCSGIKLVIKYRSDLIDIKTLEYPPNKSDDYIQGLIEQIVNDNLILLKNDIENLALKICIIFLADGNLNTLLKQSNFGEHKLICVSSQDLFHSEEDSDTTQLSDNVITKFFVNQKNFLAFSSDIRIITKLNLLNLFIFKPFIVTIAILLFALLSTNLKTLENYHKSSSLRAKAYKSLEEYRNIKNKYPYIKVTDTSRNKEDSFILSRSVDNINIADLYSIDALLKTPTSRPFNLLEIFLLNEYHEVDIKKIDWELKSFDNILELSKHKMKSIILLDFVTKKISYEETMVKLNQYIGRLKEELNNFEYNIIVQDAKTTNISSKITIPVSIVITNRYE